MAWYPYSYKTAFDPATMNLAPVGSLGQVYAIGDTGFSTPLTTYDLSGLPVDLAVQNDAGYIPSFQVEDQTSVIWKSGEYVLELVTSMPLPGPTGAKIVNATDNGDGTMSFELSDGSTVGPIPIPEGPVVVDDDVAANINNPASATATALNATYATNEYVGTLAYGTNLEATDATVANWVPDELTATGAAVAAQVDPKLDKADADATVGGYVGDIATVTGRRLREFFARKWWLDALVDSGAVGDGVTDDGPAFDVLIAKANALGELANGLGGNGVVIYLPPGYDFHIKNGTTQRITKDAVFFVGAASGGSVLSGQFGTMFKWGDGAGTNYIKSGGFKDIKLRYTVPDITACFVATDFAGELSFDNIKCAKIGQFIRAGETAARYTNGIRVSNIRGTAYNLGVPVFDLRHGAGFYLDGELVGDNVSYPADTTSAHGAVAGRSLINVSTGSWDTIMTNGFISNRFYDALNIEPAAGSSIVNVFLNNTIFDYNARSALRVIGTGGNCTKVHGSNLYMVATDGHGVHVDNNGGLFDQFHFSNSSSLFSGKNNWRFGATVKNVTLDDCNGIGANRLAATNTGDTQDGTVMAGSDWKIIGGSHGLNGQPYNGMVNQARFGLTVAAASDRYTLMGATLAGTLGEHQNLQAHTTGGGGRRVQAITSASGTRINAIDTGAHAIAATGVQMTHRLGFTAVMYVSGGTVSNILVNGVSTGLASGMVTLSPGDNWAIQYTVAPKVTRQLLV